MEFTKKVFPKGRCYTVRTNTRYSIKIFFSKEKTGAFNNFLIVQYNDMNFRFYGRFNAGRG
jgi:hypothetical protein